MEHKVTKIKLSAEAAFHKIKNWCAYQERSQHDTLQKLREFGLPSDEAQAMLAELISLNFVNEERFAISLAGGKFRIKQWGRYKIRMALQEHRVSEYCIKKALESIDENEYIQTIDKLISKKIEGQAKSPGRRETDAVARFLLSRGFEHQLIKDRISKLGTDSE